MQLRQLLQQRLGLFQIARVKTFGEPAVDRSEKIASLMPIALVEQPRSRGGRVRYCSDSDRIAALRQLSVWANKRHRSRMAAQSTGIVN